MTEAELNQHMSTLIMQNAQKKQVSILIHQICRLQGMITISSHQAYMRIYRIRRIGKNSNRRRWSQRGEWLGL
jgi:hypothetical protein